MSETIHDESGNSDSQTKTSAIRTPKSITILSWPQGLLFLIFLACKLQLWIFAGTEIANWSWWWVTCPLWCIIGIIGIMLGIGVVFVIGALIVIGIMALFGK